METNFKKRAIVCLVLLVVTLLSCKKNAEVDKDTSDAGKTGITETKRDFYSEFLSRISNEEIKNGMASFKNLNLKSDASVILNYSDFEKLIDGSKEKYAKFFFLTDSQDVLSLGLTFSNDSIEYKNDRKYILAGKHFISDSAQFDKGKILFNKYKSNLSTVSKNNPTEMILYKIDDIKSYFQMTKAISILTKLPIQDLQFDYIQFVDFKRADGTLIDYQKERDSRISFAVKTNFGTTSPKATKTVLNNLVDFYYDAGDLKP